MGLDMYLFQTEKIDGWSQSDYCDVQSFVVKLNMDDHKRDPVNIDFSKLDKPNIHLVKPKIYTYENIDYSYFTIFSEIGYWRKSNAIHDWFVKNVQDNIDDCGYYIVQKIKLEQLFSLCNKIVDNILLGPDLLPTKSGFFFGGTEYDYYYIQDIKDTYHLLYKILNETDFEKNIILYHASW